MALIAEAAGRWDEAGEQIAAVLEAFCQTRRARRPDREILAALPGDARLGGEIVLAAMRCFEAAVGRRLELVLDRASIREEDGQYHPYIGLGIGEHLVDRVDDLGASRPQAEAMSTALLALIRALGPRRSLAIVLD